MANAQLMEIAPDAADLLQRVVQDCEVMASRAVSRGCHPCVRVGHRTDGAAEGTRTPDPLITNEVLYQLSYRGDFRCLIVACGQNRKNGRSQIPTRGYA